MKTTMKSKATNKKFGLNKKTKYHKVSIIESIFETIVDPIIQEC